MTDLIENRPNQPAAWVLIALTLLVGAPLLLAGITASDVIDPAEAVPLAISSDSWAHRPQLRRGALENPWLFEALTLYYNAQPRFDLPPGSAWLSLLARWMWSLTAGEPDVHQAVAAARLATGVFVVLGLLGLLWAGRSVGDNRTAALAVLACLGTPAMTLASHVAMPQTLHMAFSALAIGAGLWAIRPFKARASLWRQGIGWTICGLAFTAAVLCVGPVAVLTIILPLAVMILICPGRINHLLGLAAALLTGAVLVMPWVFYACQHDPSAPGSWLATLKPTVFVQDRSEMLKTFITSLAVAAAVLLPWSLWLVAALVQPFSTASRDVRARLFLGWCWFLLTLLLLIVLPGQKHPRHWLVLIPPASVLIAQLFTQYIDQAAQGRFPRTWSHLRWVHTVALMVLSIALPVGLQAEAPWIRPIAAPMAWPLAVATGAALLGLTLLGLRWMLHEHPGRTAVAWSFWGIALVITLAHPLAHGPLVRQPLRHELAPVTAATGSQPWYWLIRPPTPVPPHLEEDPVLARLPVDPILLLYAQRPVIPVTLEQLTPLLREQGPLYVLAASGSLGPLTAEAEIRGTLTSRNLLLYKVRPPPDPIGPFSSDTMPSRNSSDLLPPALPHNTGP